MVEVSAERRERSGDFAPRVLNWAGAYTILFIGSAHVLIAGEHFLTATYLGVLFLANFFGSLVVAAGLFLGRYTWAWLLGDVIALGSFVGFIASRAIGLPGGIEEFVGKWLSIAGLFTTALDGLFLTLSLLFITSRGRTLLSVEEERIEEERLPPAVQETAEHRRQIEEEMEEVRRRMSPDLVDLRKHVEPQVLAEGAKQTARGYAYAVLGALRPGGAGRNPLPLVVLLVLVVAVFVARRRRARNGGERRVLIRR